MKKRIVVCGSYVTDLMARTPHLPSAGETVLGSWFQSGPGGKGFNQAVAAHKAGAWVTIGTKLGRDMFGQQARAVMKELGMSEAYVLTDPELPTGAALIAVDGGTGQNQIAVVPGACGRFTAAETAALEPLVRDSHILLTQLEIDMDAVQRLIRTAWEQGTAVVLNPAPVRPLPEDLLSMVSIITPNEVEAQALTGIEVDSEASAEAAARWFLDRGVKQAVITLGSRGVYAHDGASGRLIPARRVRAVDTTGAGDAFNGGLVTALAEGKDLWAACEFANALASLSVQRVGTAPAMPARREIQQALESR